VAMQDYVDANLSDLRSCVLPGVPEVLAALRGNGHLVGLLTGNLSRIAMAKMRHSGLDAYFHTGGFGEESEIRSHLVPAAIANAMSAVGHPLSPGRTVVIGDTPLDVEAGRIHGTRTVAVATGIVSEQDLRAAGPDLFFPSFEDPERAVEEMENLVGHLSRHPPLFWTGGYW